METKNLLAVGLLGVGGFLAYKSLKGGSVVTAPPFVPPSNAPGMTLPVSCTTTDAALIAAARTWAKGDTSASSLVKFVSSVPVVCRPALGNFLVMVGVARNVVDRAIAQSGG
jgi:hypothetical protein